jgi:hypothetical protein
MSSDGLDLAVRQNMNLSKGSYKIIIVSNAETQRMRPKCKDGGLACRISQPDADAHDRTAVEKNQNRGLLNFII